MDFTPIASSSKGNAYLLESPGVGPLLIEAGIPMKQLREKLHFGVSGLAGCLISHEHMDHAKAVKALLKAGVDCYMSKGTAEALSIQDHYRTIYFLGAVRVGPWLVQSVSLEHDAAEPFGFFIEHSKERLLFIPDTGFVKNRFEGVNILAIECNHLEEKLSQNILNGSIPAVAGRRTRRNHMSLERVITMLKSNDLSKCRAIYLLHLSDGNSSEEIMRKKVQEATGVPVYVCES